MKVMMYDRCAYNGAERLLKNFRAISSAAPSSLGLDLQTYDRHKRFGTQDGAEDVLLQETFPYDAVIINADAAHYQHVLDSAQMGLELSQRPADRIIALWPAGLELPQDDGIQYVRTHGGNGYLLPDDARYVVRILDGIKNGQPVH